MPSPFPGMDPYLERPGLWSQVHTNLINDIQRFLAPIVRPRYQVVIEQRTYLSLSTQTNDRVGAPDVLVVTPTRGGTSPASLQPSVPEATQVAAEVSTKTNGHYSYTVDLPMPDSIRNRWLEVRDQITGHAVTVIEILSPSNKTSDRESYERKRLKILASDTNFIEVDLLRMGQPMTMTGDVPNSLYRIIISRAHTRPSAQALLFGIRVPIPDVPVPLQLHEAEVSLPLNRILHDIYTQVGYDLSIDYSEPPTPRLPKKEAAWAQKLLASQQ